MGDADLQHLKERISLAEQASNGNGIELKLFIRTDPVKGDCFTSVTIDAGTPNPNAGQAPKAFSAAPQAAAPQSGGYQAKSPSIGFKPKVTQRS